MSPVIIDIERTSLAASFHNRLLSYQQPLIGQNGRLLFLYRKQITGGNDQQKDRIRFTHTYSPPFGGKMPPQDLSRPRTFLIHYRGHSHERSNILSKKPVWSIPSKQAFSFPLPAIAPAVTGNASIALSTSLPCYHGGGEPLAVVGAHTTSITLSSQRSRASPR